MRYWAYLSAKLAVAAAFLYGLLAWIGSFWPPAPHLSLGAQSQRQLLLTLTLMVWFGVAAAALYFIVYDQRYRCRTCLRRLRMPVQTGSWGRMLQLGRPRIEYICPYGHGTLKEEELQISGLATPQWTRNSDDVWEELCASVRDDRDR